MTAPQHDFIAQEYQDTIKQQLFLLEHIGNENAELHKRLVEVTTERDALERQLEVLCAEFSYQHKECE
jgi:hypothetical protein